MNKIRYPGLYNPERSKFLSTKERKIAKRILNKTIYFGLKTFDECNNSAKGGDENLAILLPYLHMIEMVDAISVLVEEAAPIPVRLQLRSAFEALLFIEWLTEEDFIRRAHAYLVVSDIRRRILIYKSFSEKTDEGKRLRKDLSEDKLAKDVVLPNISNIEKRIKNLEKLLKKAKFSEAYQEFKRLKAAGRKNPSWYELFGGPSSLEELARHLNRGYEYFLLYRTWSQTSHVSDVYRQLQKGANGGPAVLGLRNTGELCTTVTFAITFFMDATRAIIKHYIPAKEKDLNEWYLKGIRKGYLELSSAGIDRKMN